LASLKEFAVEIVSQFEMCFPQHSSIWWFTLWCTWFHKYRHWVPCTCMRCGHMSVSCQY
jgi:hypothetical protein